MIAINIPVQNNLNSFCEFLDQKSDQFTSYALPKLKHGYSHLVEKFPQLKERAYDPFPVTTYLKVSEKMEFITARISNLQPSKRFEFVSKSLIGFSQMIHRHVQEGNYFMKIPSKIDRYFQSFSGKNIWTFFPTLLGKNFTWINSITLGIRNMILTIIDMNLQILEFGLQTLLMNYEIEIIGYYRDIIRDVKNFAYEKVYQVAKKSIDKRENLFRKEAVINAGNIAIEWILNKTNRVIAKGGLGIAAYGLGVKSLSFLTGINTSYVHLLGLPIITTNLWKYSLKPTIEPYYEMYKESYTPKIKSISKLSEKWGIKKYFIPLKLSDRLFLFR